MQTRMLLRSSFTILLFAAILLPAAVPGYAQELRGVSAGAVQPAVRTLLDAFHAQTGQRAVFLFAPVGATRSRASSGDPADLVILPPSALDELEGAGAIVRETRANLWSVGIGVAISRGAPKPALATSAELRQMLLDAPEIHHSDPALTSSAAYLAKLFEHLGVAEAIKKKTTLYPRSEDALAALRHGPSGAIALAPIPEILADPHVDLAGPLPGDAQHFTHYAGAVLTRSKQLQAAEALLRFLALPEHLLRVRALGFEGPG